MDMTPMNAQHHDGSSGKADDDSHDDESHDEDEPIKRVNSELVMSELNRNLIQGPSQPRNRQQGNEQSEPPLRTARAQSEDRGMFAMDDQEQEPLKRKSCVNRVAHCLQPLLNRLLAQP